VFGRIRQYYCFAQVYDDATVDDDVLIVIVVFPELIIDDDDIDDEVDASQAVCVRLPLPDEPGWANDKHAFFRSGMCDDRSQACQHCVLDIRLPIHVLLGRIGLPVGPVVVLPI
jgi:hypothetical protein